MNPLFNPISSKTKRRDLRINTTGPELKLWTVLRGKQISDCKFRRQFGVGKFILDFYSPEIRLAIEVDGHTHADPETKTGDNERKMFLESQGIKCLRFTNEEVMTNTNGVLYAIQEEIGKRRRYTPSHSPC